MSDDARLSPACRPAGRPRCYCCDRPFRPDRSRLLCTPCYNSVLRLGDKSREQIDEVERRALLTAARCQLAREWPVCVPLELRRQARDR